MPVYTQQRRNDTFLYATGLPALEEISVCFWLFGVSDDDDRRRDALFSIASQSWYQLFGHAYRCKALF